jgi:hypothetical protein
MKPILDRTKSKAEAYARAQHRRASTSLFHRVAGGHKQHRRHSHPELLVCRIRLTNSFFLKDRCSLSDQISFYPGEQLESVYPCYEGKGSCQ